MIKKTRQGITPSLPTFAPPRGISTVASVAAAEPEKTGSCGSGDIEFTCGTFCI